jgi:hypothetical protein
MTRRIARRSAGSRAATLIVTAVLGLMGCAAPASPTPAAAEKCLDLGEEIVQLAWSQTGSHLAVGTIDAAGMPGARIVTADGPAPEASGPRTDPGMLPETVVAGPSGELAWIAETATGRSLVEAERGGSTPLPDEVTGIAWTAIGYALLQRRPGGGTRILLLDIDRPDDPNTLYETDLVVGRLWVSADPEFMLLTIAHPDHLDMRPSFDVVSPDGTRHLEPPGADLTGGSMPASRAQVVYRSAADGRMRVVRLSEPGSATMLSERRALLGRVSDPGILAIAAANQVGRLCLVDVAALLR